MKKIFKRLLSVMLALVMVVGMVPVSNLTIAQAATTYNGTIYFDNSESKWDSVYVYTLSDLQFHPSNGTDDNGYYKFDVENWGETDVFFTSSNNWGTIKEAENRRTAVKGLEEVIAKVSKAAGDGGTIDGLKVYSVSVSDYTGGGTTDTPTPTVTPTPTDTLPDTPPAGTKRIYLDTTKNLLGGWDSAYLHMWIAGTDGSSTTVKMVEISDGVFAYDVSLTYNKIIFKPNEGDWKNQTNNLDIPTGEENLFTCTYFGDRTSGVWGVYGVKEENNFPSNVTGKVTFFDLYTDTEIKGSTEYYGLDDTSMKYRVYEGSNYTLVDPTAGRSFTSIGRAFSNNVNKKIAAYWTNNNNSVYPLYFGNFQPFYMVEPQTTYDSNAPYTVNAWWASSNSYRYESNGTCTFWRKGYMDDINSVTNFSWFLNRSVDVDNGGESAMYGAVVKGIAGDKLVNGNIVAKGTNIVLPQFNPQFYKDNSNIGKMYPTMEFPFAIRTINGAEYYQFDSGVNGSTNRDTVRMNEEGTALVYYNDDEHAVKGITATGVRTPGFFPFNDPEDCTGTDYSSENNKLNYGFGMKLEIEFTINENGKVKDTNGNEIPAVFEFSGDDDVWIYVDNKLALDLGGNHGVAQGKLDFSNNKAVVQYVKTVGGSTNASDAITKENTYWDNGLNTHDYINSMSAGTGVDANESLSTSSGSNITSFECDKSDPTEIHTLTIFYEERGMFESNFKATFNLEQPTILKTTNTVNVNGVNAGLQDATKTAVADETFTYEINNNEGADVTGKKYTTETGSSKDFNGTMELKDGQSATFTKQFDRKDVLELIQSGNDKYNTFWIMSELSDFSTGKTIAASIEENKSSLVVGDGRVDGKGTSAFMLENADNGADQSNPAEVQVDYVQEPKTGGIAIKKVMADESTPDAVFQFEVKLANIFGTTSAQAAYDLSYDIYDAKNYTIIRKDATAADGIVELKAGQFALISGIPMGTEYEIVEVEKEGYSLTELDATTNKSNDTVSGDKAARKVTGTVAADSSQNVDMFVYTNDIGTLSDSFLVEVGKTNTLNVIPTTSKDGSTLTGNLEEISNAWSNWTAPEGATGAKKGFVFIVDGKPYVDKNNKPYTSYTTADGVKYTVTEKDGDPVITVTPDANMVKDKNTISVKYQLVPVDANGAIMYKTSVDPSDPSKTVEELRIITSVITMTNYLYKANDDVYVLDYGLDVDLAEKSGSGLFENDKLANKSLTGTTSTYWNTAKGEIESTASADTKANKNTANVPGTYGTIEPTADKSTEFLIDAVTTDDDGNKTVHNPKITYSLDKFLNAKDSFNYGVMIQTAGAAADQTSNRFRLNVTSNISIYPANVVYYEDSFTVSGATDSTAKIVYSGTVETEGEEYDLTQSNDQSEQYGYDDAYTDDDTTVATGDSAGSSTKLTANGYNTKAVFTFTGTGFDIIARTNDSTAGISCIIEKLDSDGKVTSVETIGVDTYYSNGDLYQIPVIHKELEHGTYKVTLGIKASTKGTVIYLDGIRIYNPLGDLDEDASAAYIDNEEGATFTRVSDMILGDGKIIENGITVDGVDTIKEQSIPNAQAALLAYGDELLFKALGYSKTENMETSGAASSKSVLTYLNAGPNNEIYLDDEGILAFVVKEDANITDRTIQIEAKLLNLNTDSVSVEGEHDLCVINEDGDAVSVGTVSSSTAMYYNIPIEKCIALDDGTYLVAIRGNYDPNSGFCISFSNMKTKGYNISNPLESAAATENYIETATYTEKVFKGIDELKLQKRTWYTEQHVITLNEDVFNGNDPEFKMYYVTANGTKKEISVTAKKNANIDNAYNLTFKSPNAIGEFPVQIYYVVDEEISEEYLATSMRVTN